MPWPTTDGLRILRAGEASLIRRVLDVMTEQTLSEISDPSHCARYGIDWFDQWDPEQRLWLLDSVAKVLLTDVRLESPAAIYDATVDSIFIAAGENVEAEIDQRQCRWRTLIHNAVEDPTANRSLPGIESDQTGPWRDALTSISDRILGPRAYSRAEAFRDGDYRRTEIFLQQRGLPEDYLTRIPPVRSSEQATRSAESLRRLIG